MRRLRSIPAVLTITMAAGSALAPTVSAEPAAVQEEQVLLAQAEAPPGAPGAPPKPSQPPKPKRLYVGGGMGLAFGDVTYVQVQPLLGYQVDPRFLIGGSLIYRYSKDDRYADSVSTTDYGASGFARFDIQKGFFAQGEYEHLNYEFPVVTGGTERQAYDSIFLGPGFSSPVGGNGSFYAALLYNFNYDSNDLNSPYDNAWVVRVGVGFGF